MDDTQNEPRRPRLLVSVRDAREAAAAVRGGADLIDVKEPDRGSLGMADAAMMADVVRQVGVTDEARHVALSAALGELSDWMPNAPIPALPAGLDFAKLGLAGAGRSADWRDEWLRVRRGFDAAAESPFGWIAVVYADWQVAEAPDPFSVVAAARESDCAGVLLDTYAKTGDSVFDLWPAAELDRLGRAIRRCGLLYTLAGGVRLELLPKVLSLEPDIVAIRTAACEGNDRRGSISAASVDRFRAALQNVEMRV